MKDPDDVFKQVKENVVRLFQKELDSQVIFMPNIKSVKNWRLPLIAR